MSAADPLQRLLDRQAIEELKAKYCRCLDQKRWDEFRAIFTDDASIDVGTIRCTSADEFVAAARERTQGATTVHQCTMPEVEVGADTATGIWAMTDLVQRAPGPWPDGLAGFHGYGHYYEEYRRTPDGWRIASVRVQRLRLDVIPADPADSGAGTG
jgi:hypothetical protein